MVLIDNIRLLLERNESRRLRAVRENLYKRNEIQSITRGAQQPAAIVEG